MSERDRLDRFADLSALARVCEPPAIAGDIRTRPDDFMVQERLPFTPEGGGEHLYLHVRKRGQNTRWVAAQLARVFDTRTRDIGYAGLKDRHAVAEQWFSVWLPGRIDPDLARVAISGVDILRATRHPKKLRRGMLTGNRFVIRVRKLAGDIDALQARLGRLRDTPVPNYFGSQRFGHARRNLTLLDAEPGRSREPGRRARNFGLSAIRAALFNGYLSARIAAGSWNAPVPGEIRYFPTRRTYRLGVDASSGRADSGFATGLLWGVGTNLAKGEALRLENQYFDAFPATTRLLEGFGLRMTRRPLVAEADGLTWRIEGDQVSLQFELARGQYATAVLRELIDITDVAAA